MKQSCKNAAGGGGGGGVCGSTHDEGLLHEVGFIQYFCAGNQGWIQHDPVGGGGALPALVPSCVGHACRSPINLLDYCKVLLDYCI